MTLLLSHEAIKVETVSFVGASIASGRSLIELIRRVVVHAVLDNLGIVP